MCYFSDAEYRKTMKGVMKQDDLPKLAHAFFSRALKLQIGCGAEPSLFTHNRELITLAKQYKVPYVSMTTNANLFSEEDLWGLAEAGLDEITLSLHGVTREDYEFFMTNASYEAFLKALSTLTAIKEKNLGFKIRVNYTVNKDNMEGLAGFFDAFGSYRFDILQIRPIQKIGDSEYDTFEWDSLYERYDKIINKVREDCARYGVTCIAPEKSDLLATDDGADGNLLESTYCYISPRFAWKKDFDLDKDTFNSYARAHHLGRTLFGNIFKGRKRLDDNRKKLNYTVS